MMNALLTFLICFVTLSFFFAAQKSAEIGILAAVLGFCIIALSGFFIMIYEKLRK